MDTNKMLKSGREQVDKAVLNYYQNRVGACAHYCASALKLERLEISKSLQRLKRQGLMVNVDTYWKVTP
jgi:biotin operon repressor